NGVVGLTELLVADPPREQRREYLKLLRESSRNLMRIIGDFLDFAKMAEGKLLIEPAPFAFKALLKSIQSTYRALARDKRLHFETELDPILPARIVGDSLRINQALQNLLNNA